LTGVPIRPDSMVSAAAGKFLITGFSCGKNRKSKECMGFLKNNFTCFLKGLNAREVLLERRLDNVVYRLGFANSRAQGRQFVLHNHFLVNSKKVNIPSFLVKVGDAIEVKEKSKKIAAISDSIEAVVRRGIPQWLELEKEKSKGVVNGFPVREDLTMPIQEQLIVELYSK
jgi:small subunit ribosomal protein S4